MPVHICPNCKIFSFQNLASLRNHVNKCSSILQKRVYRPNIFSIVNEQQQQQQQQQGERSNKILKLQYEDDDIIDDIDISTSKIPKDEVQYQQHQLPLFSPTFEDRYNDEQHEEQQPDDYITKYYNWQIKLGNILFSGSKRINDSVDGTSFQLSTPISSLTNSFTTGIGSFMRLGRVKDINGLFFGIPDVNDVIDIFTFAKLNLLSESTGDGLLKLLKDSFRRHSEAIHKYFIYDRIENLNGAVTKAVSQIYHCMDITITLPTRLCGTDQQEKDKIKQILDFRNRNLSEYIIAKGNGLNLVDLIAEYLITININDIDLHPVTLLDE